MAANYRLGYGPNLDFFSPDQKFRVCMSPLQRMPDSAFFEAQATARKIADDFGGHRPKLCLSGGLDSEIMALAFLSAGIPFDAYTLKFKDDLNAHEIRFAVDFCLKFQIPHHFVELDVIDFFTGGRFKSRVDKYHCHLVECSAQLWFLDQVGENFVWGGEPCRVFREGAAIKLQSFCEVEAIFERYLQINNLTAVSNFHFYSSELVAAFLQQSFTEPQELIIRDHSPEYLKQKIEFYVKCGFKPGDLSPGRLSKLHGFELVKKHFDRTLASSGTSYNEIYRRPVSARFPPQSGALLEFAKPDPFLSRLLSGI